MPWAMFKNLLDQNSPAQAAPTLGVLYAAVLVRVARADDDYAQIEKSRIDAILAERFECNESEASDIRAEGEKFDAQTGDTVHITRALKEHVPFEERAELIGDMWRIVLADDNRDYEETALMRLITSLLGVPDRDSAIIRQEVMTSLT